MKRKFSIGDSVWRFGLLIWALGIAFPLIWIIVMSLKTNQEFFLGAWSLPSELQLNNYIKAWVKLGIGPSFLNTLYVLVFGMLISVFFDTMNAYALTRIEWKGRNFIKGLIFMGLLLPGINALVPLYTIMRGLGMVDSLNGLILVYGFGGSVFDLVVLGSFMSSIPIDMEESAHLDGATVFKTFWHIIVPISAPGIVTISIFKFLTLYNDFTLPFILLNDSKKYTIGINMYYANEIMQYSSNWVSLCAGIVISLIPPLVVYILLQKRVIEGATLGAVKG